MRPTVVPVDLALVCEFVLVCYLVSVLFFSRAGHLVLLAVVHRENLRLRTSGGFLLHRIREPG